MFIREGLLRFARNGQYVIKDILPIVIARVLSEAISCFLSGELAAALL
ncbi:MAG: hypothetical protein L3J18_04485 [Candidatus Brocadia sp.]|nr:hypothetical protein [Candidatus Brocadia sp.]UJS21569.1 MAG: hypothetical protein L3J18_04485 [Candidatus Brocadia sp.]